MPLPVSDQVWDDAYAIQHHVRTLDALHLATCQLVGAVLLSTDAGMLHVAQELELKVHPASYGCGPVTARHHFPQSRAQLRVRSRMVRVGSRILKLQFRSQPMNKPRHAFPYAIGRIGAGRVESTEIY